MKNNYFKIITAICFFIVLTLQGIWLYNTYSLIKRNIYERINPILEEAVNKEAQYRFNHTPGTTKIEGGNTTGNNLPSITFLEEGLWKLGYPVSIGMIDSIVCRPLEKLSISSEEYSICLINPSNHEILERSKDRQSSSWDVITSDTIYTRTDLSQGIQLVILNPYRVIFKQTALLLATTVIMVLLVCLGLDQQRKMIVKEKKITRQKLDYSHAIIHSINTPLSIIKNCVQGLQLPDNKRLRTKEDYFNIIDEKIQQLSSLSQQALNLFKLENQKVSVNKTEVQLSPVIEELKKEFLLKASKGVRFVTNLQTETVRADRTYLKEVLSNLIDNSIKYSGKAVEITISSESDKQNDIIKVHDNGIGIPLEEQAIIFEKFERASATLRTRKGGPTGFGLGLNYVSQIMHVHGGRITVSSTEGEYTEFQLYLPKSE